VAEEPRAERDVFVDTGYLLALERRTDENHRRALGHWRSLRGRGLPRLVTSTYVFDEVVTYLNSRGLHASAVKTGKRLLGSPSVELVHVGDALFRVAFNLLEGRPDKRYSLTDCVSFVLMRERGISVALAFDRHFEQEGFAREPHTG
jgi:uncharacterized protein